MVTTVILPFNSNGKAINVPQTPGGAFSHKGYLYNSWDFSLAAGSKVLAVLDGTVVDVRETVPDGLSTQLSYKIDKNGNLVKDAAGKYIPISNPSLGSGAIGNFVTLKHEVNGTIFYTSYFHLQKDGVLVSTGDTVKQGDTLGYVGNTGARDGTHLHFQVGTKLTTNTGDKDGTAFFGATKHGATDSDTGLQMIADASNLNANKDLINFKGYETKGYNLPSSVIGTFVPEVQVSVNDSSAYEGEYIVHTVSLAPGQTAKTDIVIKWFTGPGDGADGASSAAKDYTGITSGSVTIKAGTSSATFKVLTTPDNDFESDEFFFVNLQSAQGAKILDGQGKSTIKNDDAAPPKASISDAATTTEGGNLVFNVTLDRAATAETKIYFEILTSDSSASSSDYIKNSGFVTIAKGSTTAKSPITIVTNDDPTVESTETLAVRLFSPTAGVSLGDAIGVGSIKDNDVAAVVKPDIVIQNLKIDDSTVNLGQKVKITYDGVNLTNGTAVTSESLVFISRDMNLDMSDIAIKNVNLGSMTAYERDAESTTFNIPTSLASGRYYVGVWADGGRAVVEANELNNVAWTAFSIL